MSKKKKSFNSKEVKNKKKILDSLILEKKKLEVEIKKTSENIEIIAREKISEELLNKLPIESLKELYIKSESVTDSFNNYAKEKKKKIKYLDKISSVDNEIYQAKIDLVIEKINSILKDLI